MRKTINHQPGNTTLALSKLLAAVLLSVLMVYGFTSCRKVKGEGPVVTQSRNIENFTGIDLRIPGDVYFRKDSIYKVELVAQQNIIDIIETSIEDNRLQIKFKSGRNYHTSDDIKINVSGPDMSSLLLSSAGSIYMLSSISPSNLLLRVDGSGSISLQNFNTHSLEAFNNGSGSIKAGTGNATTGIMITEGSGRIDLSGISVRSVSARTVGSGNIRLNATDNLYATISGSGSIYYKGHPTISSHIAGTGNVIHF